MPFSNFHTYSVSGKVLMLLVFFLLPMTATAQKIDLVKFKNGDQLTVDIKGFERGMLRASTIGFGTIHIEWEVIDSISTNKLYRIELNSGTNMLGSVHPGQEGETLTVRTGRI